VDGVFELKRKDDYDFVDKDGRSIPLPGKPYLAIRIRLAGPSVKVAPPVRDHET